MVESNRQRARPIECEANLEFSGVHLSLKLHPLPSQLDLRFQAQGLPSLAGLFLQI